MSFFPWLDSANGQDAASRWTIWGGPSQVTSGSPSNRGYYNFPNSGLSSMMLSIPDTTSLLVGWKMRLSSSSWNTTLYDGNAAANLYQVLSDNGATLHLNIGVRDGKVRVRFGSGTGTVIAESTNVCVYEDVWHDWEVRSVIDDTNGRCEIWIDGVQVINFTGDTKNGGTKTDHDVVRFGRDAGHLAHQVCDIVIDSATTPKGPTVVWDSYPTADGANTGLTPSTGTNHAALVDEANPNGDTDYNYGSTEGNKDTYAMGNLPAGSWDILAVQVSHYSRKSDAGVKYARPIVRTGATDYAGTSEVLAESYVTKREAWATNPNTASAWTESEVDALEAGVEVRDS